jgi:transposase InsO family protein
VRQIIHTDLHWSKRYDCWMIAFIDALSRKIVYLAPVANKTSAEQARHLRLMLDGLPARPDVVFSDNGPEFIGHEFQGELRKDGIAWRHTPPYTPEINGKMERFWPNIDNLAVDDDTPIADVVAHYNAKISRAFGDLRSRRTVPTGIRTPNDAWDYDPWRFQGPGTEPYLCEIWADQSVGTKLLPSPSWQGTLPEEPEEDE